MSEIISHKEIENTVFNSATINSVISKFTEKDDLTMLLMVKGEDKEKLIGIKSKLESLKARTIQFSARTAHESVKSAKDSSKKSSTN